MALRRAVKRSQWEGHPRAQDGDDDNCDSHDDGHVTIRSL